MGGQQFCCKRYRCKSLAARESVVGGQIAHGQQRVVVATFCRSVSGTVFRRQKPRHQTSTRSEWQGRVDLTAR